MSTLCNPSFQRRLISQINAINRYACLVAEPRNGSRKELAGVVDVTVLSEDSVLQHLLGAKEYIYVSGIAVLNKFRFKTLARTLDTTKKARTTCSNETHYRLQEAEGGDCIAESL